VTCPYVTPAEQAGRAARSLRNAALASSRLWATPPLGRGEGALSTIRLCARAGESTAASPIIGYRIGVPPNRNADRHQPARNPPSGRVLHGPQGRSCYSITSSARSMIDGGMARPSAVAVLRFTTIANFVVHREIARLVAAQDAINIG